MRRSYGLLAAVALLPVLLCSALPAAVTAQAGRSDPVAVPDSAWIHLLKGDSLAGWTPKIRGETAGSDIRNTFHLRDGVLQVRYDGYDAFEERFGHLFFDTPQSHYRLRLEYRFVGDWLDDTPGWARRNSGIMFHAQSPGSMPVEQDFPISLEAQFLGELEPGSARPTMNLCTPGTHVVIEGAVEERHCTSSTSATYPAGEWVEVELLVLGDSLVQHRVAGETVLEYRDPVIGGGAVNGFDPEVKPDGVALGSGFIALQAEGQPLDFRNIRLAQLKGCTDPASPAFRSWYVEPDPAACSGATPPHDDEAPRMQRVRRLLETLAADSMMGREAGTPGELKAVRVLEAELERYGVEPAGTAGFRQPVPLVEVEMGEGRARWTVVPDGVDRDTIPAERLRTAYNVLGVIPGADPELADEVVVVGAHHDHVGVGPAVEGDSIYNGADDDASGTVAALEIAREFARARARGEGPGRTILVAFFTAEEMGLAGTRYWIENPTLPFDHIVADLQIEMIARPDSLAGGFGGGWLTGYERSTMGDVLAAQGSPIVPDPRPEMRFFFRSDNLPFAQLGIPAHTLSSYNLHRDYHRPSDEAELVDYPHMTSLVEAAIAMMDALSSGPTPQWKEGGRPVFDGGNP